MKRSIYHTTRDDTDASMRVWHVTVEDDDLLRDGEEDYWFCMLEHDSNDDAYVQTDTFYNLANWQ